MAPPQQDHAEGISPEISLCLSPCWRHPTSSWGVGDRVHHGRVLPAAQPRSNFPPLCLPSLGSWSNLQSPTISLPPASAGCSSSMERSTSATLLWALQYRRLFVLFCPPHQGLWVRLCRGVPPTNPLPFLQSELVGQLGSVPAMGFIMADI